MRSHVNSRWFLYRKYIDNTLHMLMPSTFIPLYSMVTFTRIRYHKVVLQWKWQNRVINAGLVTFGCIMTCWGTYLLIKYFPQIIKNETFTQLAFHFSTMRFQSPRNFKNFL
ncbi:hypothetical protein GDO78_017280 [Eleutherodactylus coqui]|uniref:Uncharacterized protein n=2 Tax=Eleutherodactylus coqui TaxID=57060 RepID=A0A8J6EBA0_ELECQ|nr:hypothetical protein GDO78_017280 [Eleutherodactylus coqui]